MRDISRIESDSFGEKYHFKFHEWSDFEKFFFGRADVNLKLWFAKHLAHPADCIEIFLED